MTSRHKGSCGKEEKFSVLCKVVVDSMIVLCSLHIVALYETFDALLDKLWRRVEPYTQLAGCFSNQIVVTQ